MQQRGNGVGAILRYDLRQEGVETYGQSKRAREDIPRQRPGIVRKSPRAPLAALVNFFDKSLEQVYDDNKGGSLNKSMIKLHCCMRTLNKKGGLV